MNGTITRGDLVISPTIILNVSSDRESRNVFHPIIGRSDDDVTTRPASLRAGTLELGFSGPDAEASSALAEAAHAASGVFTLVAPERTSLGFSYVTNGRITRELEQETRDNWLVRVDYREVIA